MQAQEPTIRGFGGGRTGSGGGFGGGFGGLSDRFRNMTGGRGGGQADSLKKRDYSEDSINITYRFLNDAQRYKLDTIITDYRYFPTQPDYITLGNTGSASKPILFYPIMAAGFDEGKHSYDQYKWNVEGIRFYNTNKPFTQLDYILGSKAEQNIGILHTQNIQPTWNAAFDYKLISAPGYFVTQKNNQSNLAFNSYYVSKKKRYANWFAIINNNNRANDNGGVSSLNLLKDPTYNDRILIPTNLNYNPFTSRNPFDSKLETGTQDKQRITFLRQSYDFGKKDSIAINDSTTQYLFYPKLRLEHTLVLEKSEFGYKGLRADSNFFKANYGADTLFTKSIDEFFLSDNWRNYKTDFSIYQFPDTKNQLQYFKAGIGAEIRVGEFLQGKFRSRERTINNTWVHGTYRNRTRNKKWDFNTQGQLYLSGYNSGDYSIYGHLVSNLGSKLGNLQLKFQNVNRTPSFIFYNESAFRFAPAISLKKENHTTAEASFFDERKEQMLGAALLLCTNLTTWQSPKSFRQEAAFSMLQVRFERKFKIYRKWVWHAEVQAQQVLAGNPRINYAPLYNRNRFAYEGNFGKKNLRMATGLEVRYLLPYKLDAWSPLTGQFTYSDSTSSSSNLPDIHVYAHLNITRFSVFMRAENLNTVRFVTGNVNPGIQFMNNNFAAVRFPNPGLVFRMGFYWRFIN